MFNCPFCGSVELHSDFEQSQNAHSVLCGNCGARGPLHGTANEAEEAWNDRSGAIQPGGAEIRIDPVIKARIADAIYRPGRLAFYVIFFGVALMGVNGFIKSSNLLLIASTISCIGMGGAMMSHWLLISVAEVTCYPRRSDGRLPLKT